MKPMYRNASIVLNNYKIKNWPHTEVSVCGICRFKYYKYIIIELSGIGVIIYNNDIDVMSPDKISL